MSGGVDSSLAAALLRERGHEAIGATIKTFCYGEIPGSSKTCCGLEGIADARTVAHDPPVLIFDEPTVGLDVLNALEMQKVIREFRDEGKAILFSTHVMSEAEKLCDTIAIIHQGKILASDSLDGLRASTGCRYLEDIFVHFVENAGTKA